MAFRVVLAVEGACLEAILRAPIQLLIIQIRNLIFKGLDRLIKPLDSLFSTVLRPFRRWQGHCWVLVSSVNLRSSLCWQIVLLPLNSLHRLLAATSRG